MDPAQGGDVIRLTDLQNKIVCTSDGERLGRCMTCIARLAS
jgi:sporulation protein YlmC with PRC-barrel domain